MIRLREISVRLDMIYIRCNIYANVFFEHESNESNESCKCVALAFLRTTYVCKITACYRTIFFLSSRKR